MHGKRWSSLDHSGMETKRSSVYNLRRPNLFESIKKTAEDQQPLSNRVNINHHGSMEIHGDLMGKVTEPSCE